MIALKQDMPSHCLNCPNLSTCMVEGKAIRACAAAGLNIIYMCDNQNLADNDEWENFTKPDWCPLIEIVLCKDCWNYGTEHCPMVEMNTEGEGDIVLNNWASPQGFCHYGKKDIY